MPKFLTSRLFWTVLGVVALDTLQAYVPFMPPIVQVGVNAVLLALTTYFHQNPSRTYNLPSDGSAELTPLGRAKQI